MNDLLAYSNGKNDIEEKNMKKTYCLLIVDDEVEIHTVTRLALSDYDFEGTPLEILSAYSAEEAKALLKEYEKGEIHWRCIQILNFH